MLFSSLRLIDFALLLQATQSVDFPTDLVRNHDFNAEYHSFMLALRWLVLVCDRFLGGLSGAGERTWQEVLKLSGERRTAPRRLREGTR